MKALDRRHIQSDCKTSNFSCAPNPLKCGGTGGCSGSIEPLAYTYASLFGVVTEAEYPYESQYGQNDDVCKFDARQTEADM